MALELFEHNQTAYLAVEELLEEVGRAAVIHPTGTGKSFIAFKLCENHCEETFCWLSPSSYIFQTQLENVKKSTGEFEAENICFFTYAKLMHMEEEEILSIAPSYIILDEFHRCGAEMWGDGVRRLLAAFPEAKLLGLSATAIRYLDNQRDMSDELFDGNIASEMTLGEAIVRGILSPPKYVTAMYTYGQIYDRYNRRIARITAPGVRREGERYLQALRRTIEQADGLPNIFKKHLPNTEGKYIVFCTNVEHMREMIEHVPEWFATIDAQPHVYSAYSDDPETSEAFAAFKEDTSQHLKLLFCINMLNEGVHVEDIDGVVLFRPTVSPIVFKQQIGRALCTGKQRNPVIFDIVNNIENLYSIADIREEMSEAILFYQQMGEGQLVVNDSFTIIDELQDCKRLFEELERTLSASWEDMYQAATKFYQKYGHLLPMQNYETAEGYKLGQWVVTQRQRYSNSTIPQKQVQRLEAIGMNWLTFHERQWEQGYQQAVAYAEKWGNIAVVRGNPKLKSWIVTQRQQYRRSRLTKDQIDRLTVLGMVWEPEDRWQTRFSAAERFFQEYGSLDIPANYITEDGIALGQWYRSIRRQYADGVLSKEKCRQLETIGMQWDSLNDRNWFKKYMYAKAYFEEYGHLRVPVSYVTEDGERLGTWISAQREAYAKGLLTAARIERLEELNMSWQHDLTRWEIAFSQVVVYCEKYGHANIPAGYMTEDHAALGSWLAAQRRKYKAGKLTTYQIERLEGIGVLWDPAASFWELAYKHAATFFQENGHLRVPSKFVCDDGFFLGSWISNMKTRYKKGELSESQIERLQAIQMCFPQVGIAG